MFNAAEFTGFVVWLVDDLLPAERAVWLAWLCVYCVFLVCCRRDWRERFSLN